MSERDDDIDDWTHDDDVDAGAECGRWDNGRLRPQCTKAGSEECDWLCPIGLPRHRPRKKAAPLLDLMEN